MELGDLWDLNDLGDLGDLGNLEDLTDLVDLGHRLNGFRKHFCDQFVHNFHILTMRQCTAKKKIADKKNLPSSYLSPFTGTPKYPHSKTVTKFVSWQYGV